jgi:hypothetical protein
MNALRTITLWLMRAGLVLYAVMRYYKNVLEFQTESVMFWVEAIYVASAILMFVGGFMQKSWVTVSSAVVMVFVTGYLAVSTVRFPIDYNFAVFVIVGSVVLFFAISGNEK